jgi:hypothetical protein
MVVLWLETLLEPFWHSFNNYHIVIFGNIIVSVVSLVKQNNQYAPPF